MTHFAGEEFSPFLRLLATGDIEKDAEQDAFDDADVGTLSASRNPADLFTQANSEIDLIGTRDRACGRERRSDAFMIGRMNVGGELFETDVFSPGQVR